MKRILVTGVTGKSGKFFYEDRYGAVISQNIYDRLKAEARGCIRILIHPRNTTR